MEAGRACFGQREQQVHRPRGVREGDWNSSCDGLGRVMESSPVLTANPCTTGEGQENPPGLCSPPARNVLPVRWSTGYPPGPGAAAGTGVTGRQRQTHCTQGEQLGGRTAGTRQHKLCSEPQRDVSFSEVIIAEAKKRGPGGWEVLAKLALAALARAIRAAAWERGAGSSCSSDGALKGTGVPS